MHTIIQHTNLPLSTMVGLSTYTSSTVLTGPISMENGGFGKTGMGFCGSPITCLTALSDIYTKQESQNLFMATVTIL